MLKNIIILCGLFFKEQLKEPIAFFWILTSPSAVFYFLTLGRGGETNYFAQSYAQASAWFYAYMACSVALFGFALYIIGRREGGFTRSFIYTRRARYTYLGAHYLSYLLMAIVYSLVFYLVTKYAFGSYSALEWLGIMFRFIQCFLVFCVPASIFAILPLNFQNASTLFSAVTLLMLVVGAVGEARPSLVVSLVNEVNPFVIAKNIMLGGSTLLDLAMLLFFFLASTIVLVNCLRINPVWSRY